MEYFETTLTVQNKDLDELNHVNNVQYVYWVMDIAKKHWLNNASEDILDNYYWVLVNHCIKYKSSAVLGDIIHLKTYVTKADGGTSTRIVNMYNKESEKLIATSETIWCLMDVKTKRPTRISQEIADLFN